MRYVTIRVANVSTAIETTKAGPEGHCPFEESGHNQHMIKHQDFLRNLLLSVAVPAALLPIFASAQESPALRT